MELNAEQRIEASRKDVFAALNNPEILMQCIPGCESLEKESDTDMTATVVLRVGPIKAKFNGKVKLSNLVPPESYSISGEGAGGAAGFAKGGADIKLVEDGTATILRYEVKADVGGKLAQLGGRLIDSTAKTLSKKFFAKFCEIVEAGNSETDGGDPQKTNAPEQSAKPIPWMLIAIGVAAAFVVYAWVTSSG